MKLIFEQDLVLVDNIDESERAFFRSVSFHFNWVADNTIRVPTQKVNLDERDIALVLEILSECGYTANVTHLSFEDGIKLYVS